MRSVFAILTFILAFAGGAVASPQALVGIWYMEGVENGLHAQFIIRNADNGTFTKDIRNVTKCDAATNWIETGTWTFDGKNYIEVTQTVGGDAVDSSSPDYNDTFDYVPIDGDHFTMHDVKTNVTWALTRVPPDYKMPPATGCTV